MKLKEYYTYILKFTHYLFLQLDFNLVLAQKENIFQHNGTLKTLTTKVKQRFPSLHNCVTYLAFPRLGNAGVIKGLDE